MRGADRMKAKEILADKGTRVITIHENNLLVDAMALFFSNRIGSILVVDKNDKILGIVAPNDLLKAVYDNRNSVPDLKVSEVMTREVIVATPEDDIDYLLAVMTESRVRHIPILDHGDLVGMISIGDVAKAQTKQQNVENRYLKDYIEGKYPG